LLGPTFEDNFEDTLRVRSQINLEQNSFRVVGFISAGDPQSQNSMIIGLERMRQIYDVENELSQVVVRIQDGFTQKQVQENIEETLRRDRQLEEGDEDFSTSTHRISLILLQAFFQ